jgi:hypothetical protein
MAMMPLGKLSPDHEAILLPDRPQYKPNTVQGGCSFYDSRTEYVDNLESAGPTMGSRNFDTVLGPVGRCK